MSILGQIVEHKRKEVDVLSRNVPVSLLEKMPLFSRGTFSLASRLKDKAGIIAEFKRQSPSRQLIRQMADPALIIQEYEKAGAAAASVLTDSRFFGGSLADLLLARAASGLPLLRKDFTVSEYQLFEAKAYGADLVLLIAAVLTPDEVKQYTQLSHELGLEVLLEIHNEEELGHYCSEADMVGINNRNLNNFDISLEHSFKLASLLPETVIKVAESGIGQVEDMNLLKKAGFSGFLIGETFMRQESPGKICREFSNFLNNQFNNIL